MAISIVKHLWNQLYKSPRKRKIIDQMWCKDKEMGKYMYFLGKYKNKRNEHKLKQTVNQIKKKYKSLEMHVVKLISSGVSSITTHDCVNEKL